VLLAALTLTAVPSRAMDIEMFDALAVEDQHAYIQFLAQSAQQIFVEQGRRDLSEKVERLFRTPRRGNGQSPGATQFYSMLARTRAFAATHSLPGLHFHVEGELTQTLVNNGIAIPRTFHRRFEQLLREKPYWPKLPLATRK
jgi:hypothetical protein